MEKEREKEEEKEKGEETMTGQDVGKKDWFGMGCGTEVVPV